MCLLEKQNVLLYFFGFKSTVVNRDYDKINNKTYKTDSVCAAISKGHNIQIMF